MIYSVKQLVDLATEIETKYEGEIKPFEALQIAVQMQRNNIIGDAFGVGHIAHAPAFLEAIAMELGAAKTGGTIKDALFSIAENLEKVS